MLEFIRQHEVRVSRIAIFIVFLALIRLIGECFRVQAYTGHEVGFTELRPFLIGAFLTAFSCLVMTLLSFYTKHRAIIFIAALTIAALVVIKVKML